MMAVRVTLSPDEFSFSHLIMRFFLVALALLSAKYIQDFLWSYGQHLSDSILPGPSLSELNESLEKRSLALQLQQHDISGKSAIFALGGFFNFVGYVLVMTLEHISLTAFFFAYKWFQAMHEVVMTFLAVVGPFMISASIIPGINGFTNWLKFVVSVSLWPFVASFFLKAHLLSAIHFLGNSDISILSNNAANLFVNMDALQLMAESCLFGFFLLATPFISAALVNGSANAFAAGGSFLLGAGPLAALKLPMSILSTGGRLGGKGGQAIHSGAVLMRNPLKAPKVIASSVKNELSASSRWTQQRRRGN
ncbi:MAG: hypothetical protein COX62_08885 [Deltaproteobacteria bacterium CG_4_10_14_0_2_um_filter_43_8]|nr:MAG: hypothetical protein COX62_08885 [Deltaproteobacteria bacterium CG_4_10_14_0_2_um_filter_43_8]